MKIPGEKKNISFKLYNYIKGGRGTKEQNNIGKESS